MSRNFWIPPRTSPIKPIHFFEPIPKSMIGDLESNLPGNVFQAVLVSYDNFSF